MLAIVSYFYSVEYFVRFFIYTPMAMHTALMSVVLSAGYLYARPDRGLVNAV